MSSRPTVAFVISTLDTGGAEIQLLNTLNALPNSVNAVVFVLTNQLALRDKLQNPNVRLEVIGLRARWDLLRWLRFVRRLRRARPDVVHSHMLLSNLAARVFSRLSGASRVINHEHGLSAWKGHILNAVDRATQRLADKIVVVSGESRRRRIARTKLNPARVVVLPNAVDCGYWSQVLRDPQARTVTWGVAARLSWVKRIELALELSSHARSQGADVQLLIAGDGPERHALQARADALGVSQHVRFLGEIQDMRSFYSQIDVLLLMSSSEDCPMTVLEALACGRFVAATSVGGVPELLEGLEDALLIKETVPLAEVARTLAKVPAGFESRRNREHALRFDVKRYVDKLFELYGLAT